MPIAPRKPCLRPGCPALVAKGYCDLHRKQKSREKSRARDRGDPQVMKWWSSKRYKVKRAWFMKRNPLCASCYEKGRVEPATQLDHIVAHKGSYELFWSESNWRGLCRSCHSRKTVTEDGGFGK
jgi:5-methylcytosine-specific restriction protein A